MARFVFSLLATLGLLAAAVSPAAAQPAEQPSGLDLSLGLGAAVAPDYEGSNDYDLLPLWNLRLGNLYHPQTYVRLRGLGFDSNLLPHEHWRLGLVGRWQSDYGGVDDSRVRRLRRPEDALHAGLLFGYDFSDRSGRGYSLGLQATYDLMNGNGFLVTPQVAVQQPLSERLRLGGSLSLGWASSGYMTNRFGISAADAGRSGLSRHSAGAGFKDAAANLSLTWLVTERWTLTGFGGYRRLLGDAASSPLVRDRGSRNAFSTGALLGYRF